MRLAPPFQFFVASPTQARAPPGQTSRLAKSPLGANKRIGELPGVARSMATGSEQVSNDGTYLPCLPYLFCAELCSNVIDQTV